ncbi:MAG: iron-sulfur cluster assembly scaffold protein [Candidatus Korobacteraceae bacterium]
MYSAELLDHFEHPRNSGDLPGADFHVQTENPACGDILELSARIEAGKIEEIRFRAKGCVPAMACASALTQLAEGRSIAKAGDISKEDIVRAVGGLPPASGHAAQLAWDTLQAMLKMAA